MNAPCQSAFPFSLQYHSTADPVSAVTFMYCCCNDFLREVSWSLQDFIKGSVGFSFGPKQMAKQVHNSTYPEN